MGNSPLAEYLKNIDLDRIDNGFTAYLASLSKIAETAPGIAEKIVKELSDQRTYLKLN